MTCLNSNQRKAVERPSSGSLQILAGPGSGKTRVLICRIAYLLKRCGVVPHNLVAVTFTNKAAKEMQNRLITLLGGPAASQVILGTFHGMCVGFLRKHGAKVGLKNNWSICDRDQQLQYCKTVLKDSQFAVRIKETNLSLKPNTLLDSISKAKSHGQSPQEMLQQAETPYSKLIALMFRAYTDMLSADNCLDFDDLLLFGERLFRYHPSVIAHIEHVLIDEFQDTNTIQYQLMVLLAHRGAVTVVGDPDQGIYGFRHAQSINLAKMIKDFPKTQTQLLEENYRSSSGILKAALTIVQQDQERIDKNLYTTHPRVALPMLRPFQNPQEECAFIAQEVHRLVAYTGGQLNYNDVSVLMRYNALSRNLETAFKTAGIPIRMIGAQKFFERAEVKDILSYLQLADNPSFTPAFERTINTPRRNIGLVTIQAIRAACATHNLSPLEVLVKAVRGKQFVGLKAAQMTTFKKFLGIICRIQMMAQEGWSVAQIIDYLLEQINYSGHLERTFGQDAAQRGANIQELKAYSVHLARQSPSSPAEAFPFNEESTDSISKPGSWSDLTESNTSYDHLLSLINHSPSDVQRSTPLRRFLAESSLATDSEAEESKDDTNKPRVTICTCHSSKGLEWPVVFVTAVEDGIFPFYLCNEPEEVKEERRLLFVAMTRAQGLLYLTYSAERMQGADTHAQEVSIFLKKLLNNRTNDKDSSLHPIVCTDPPELNQHVRQELSTVIARPAAAQEVVERKIQEYHSTDRKVFNIPSRQNKWSSWSDRREHAPEHFNRWGQDSKALPLGRFSSSLTSSGPRGYFQPKSESSAFTTAARYSQNSGTGQLSSASTSGKIPSLLGKFSARPLASATKPAKPMKVAALHEPFVPPKAFKSIQPEEPLQEQKAQSLSDLSASKPIFAGGDRRPHDLIKEELVEVSNLDSTSACSTGGNQSLERLKALSTDFMSNLKNNIPEDVPDSNLVTKPTRESKTNGKRSSSGNRLSAPKKGKTEM